MRNSGSVVACAVAVLLVLILPCLAAAQSPPGPQSAPFGQGAPVPDSSLPRVPGGVPGIGRPPLVAAMSLALTPEATYILNEGCKDVTGRVVVNAPDPSVNYFLVSGSDPGLVWNLPRNEALSGGGASFTLCAQGAAERTGLRKQDRTVTITANYGGMAVSKPLTLLWPRKLSSFSLSPKALRGGQGVVVTGKATLEIPAPAGGYVLQVSSKNGQCNGAAPATVLIPEGQTTAIFSFPVSDCPAFVQVPIVVYGPFGSDQSRTVPQPQLSDRCTVHPRITIAEFSFQKETPTLYQGKIRMSANPLPLGEDVLLRLVDPGQASVVTIPSSVKVTQAQPTVGFRAVPRAPVSAPLDVPVKAIYDGKETLATLRLVP